MAANSGDLDLDDVRRRLVAEQAQLRAQVLRLRRDADDEEWRTPKPDEADQGVAAVERERLRSLADQAQTGLERVEAAIARLDAGTYGVCQVCGVVIPVARLEARPDADTCVQCAGRARQAS